MHGKPYQSVNHGKLGLIMVNVYNARTRVNHVKHRAWKIMVKLW